MDGQRNRVEVLSEGTVRVVAISGEFDVDSVAALRAALDPRAAGVRAYAVDVSGVEFADSTTLSVLLEAGLAHPVTLVGTVPPRLDRLLRLTGSDRVFGFAATAAEVTAGPETGDTV
ncbi:STAS domain-containing protein [Streptomyces sp. BI20]|uniref:STAS domain-containing protein n=1 Tax=Streptomyces sp. BI20 TaxID=3403460 RepID=UPI003C77C788